MLYETVVDDEIKDSDIYHLNLERDLLYAQIVALAHDLGHTPFGHLGERVINHKLQKMNIIEEKKHEAFEKEINLIKLQELEEGVDHSREECETKLIQEIQYKKDNILTENAKQRMEEVRKCHQQENQKDIELCDLLSKYDDTQNGLRDKAKGKRHLEKVEKLHEKTEEQYPSYR